MKAPQIAYQPAAPRRYNPAIGLIGCGGITRMHLRAYRKQGFRVVALCDIDPASAEERRREFYPAAEVHTDYRALLKRDDIEVVDIATHPAERPSIVAAALRARKHVLSQKPFVMNLNKGEELVELAEKYNVKLAVNQNGRWAPYFSYMRQAVARNIVGRAYAVHLGCHWNHEWVIGGPFDRVYHLVLYDYAIHWFDMVHCLLGDRQPQMASATLGYAPNQKAAPPLLGQVIMSFDGGQASLLFDACTPGPARETARVIGTKGMLYAEGDVCDAPSVTVTTPAGKSIARLGGHWFPDGFGGTMGELLCAIEEKREPSNSAQDNLKSLALCFAAVASADSGKSKKIGTVRSLPLDRCRVSPVPLPRPAR